MKQLLLITLLLLTGCASKCQPPPSLIAYKLEREMDRGFGYKDPNNASFSIEFVELLPNHPDMAICKMTFSNLGPRKLYNLFCVNHGYPSSGAFVDWLTLEGDTIITKREGKERSEKETTIGVCAEPGVETKWHLVSSDGKVALSSKILPTPLKAVGTDGATIELFRREAGGNFVEARISGLLEKEKISLICKSGGQEIQKTIHALSSGNIPDMIITPAIEGIKKGTCELSLLREKETLHISFDWDSSTIDPRVQHNPIAIRNMKNMWSTFGLNIQCEDKPHS